MHLHKCAAIALFFPAFIACSAASEDPDHVGVGDVEESTTSSWGHALECKTPSLRPGLAPLHNPQIVVSLDGLTLHLFDTTVGFDRVYAVAAGALDATGVSMTPTSDHAAGGVFHTGANTHVATDAQWGDYYSCRIWDVVDGVKKPVFAGLPFLRLSGTPTSGYGLHGPIDHYTDPNGGSLRRGYVSHGCVRIGADDIQEIFFLVHQHPSTPVKIQRAIERDANGDAVDVTSRWVGSECTSDAQCDGAGARCRFSSGAAQGTCTVSCTHSCADRAGEAPTFCVRDPAISTQGICVPQASSTYNKSCARFEGRLSFAHATRPDGSASSDVCVPAR